MKSLLTRKGLFVLLLLLAQGCTAQSEDKFKEGEHYSIVPDYAVSSSTQGDSKGKVTVVEFFSYGCPHCYSLEPVIDDWKKQAPDYVELSMMPAFWNPYFQLLAQAYYAGEVLKTDGKVHKSLFDAIHLQGRQIKDEGALRDFFVEQGIAEADFDKTFNSFAVKQKVKLADSRFRQYKLKGVPGLVVGGKYFTDVRMAGSREAVAEVLTFLVRKIKKENS